jgi:hypothetical protein
MSESPTDNSLDTAEIAAALVATEQTEGVDAMLTRLEETLRAQRRWHGLFDTRVLRARASLGLPLAGPLTDVAADRRGQLDEQTIAACREAGWGLFDEGQVAAGWVYLRAAVDRQEVATRLGQAADRLLAPTSAGLEDEDYQPLQELVQLALWEGLDPALGIRITLATQGTCNAVTAYEQSVAGLPPAKQEPVAALMVEHLHAELLDNLSRDLRDRALVPAATLDEIHAADGDVSALLTAAGGLTDDACIHLDASHLQAVLRFARICTAPALLRKALALATYACRLPDDFRYPGDPPFTDFGTASRLFFAALLGEKPDEALAWFRDVATAADSYDAPAAWDVVAVLAARLNRPAEAMAAVLARPADTTPTQPAPLTMMLPPLVELAHAADAGAALRAACLDRDDLITFAASLARDAAR